MYLPYIKIKNFNVMLANNFIKFWITGLWSKTLNEYVLIPSGASEKLAENGKEFCGICLGLLCLLRTICTNTQG